MKMLAPILFAIALVAPITVTPVQAQDVAPDGPEVAEVVAIVNGEAITAERLDALWHSMTPELIRRYEQAGGKTALLDNYIRKRLLLQEAARNGFPGADAELSLKEESALFNRYVREHFGPLVVTDDVVATFYAQNPDLFRHLDQTLVRQIFVSTKNRTPEAARAILGGVLAELRQTAPGELSAAFAEAARKHSEDEVSARNGGSLGWRERVRLEPELVGPAFKLDPGTMSDLLQTENGIHLLYIEDRRPAGIESLERATPAIRQSLISTNSQKLIKAADERTNELMNAGEIEIFPENIR